MPGFLGSIVLRQMLSCLCPTPPTIMSLDRPNSYLCTEHFEASNSLAEYTKPGMVQLG